MKPCPSHRESVALLACGALPAGEADELHQHLQTCAGCREYLRQLSAVCADHTAAAHHLADGEVSPRLHGRIAAAIRADADQRRNDFVFAGFTYWARLAGVATLLVLLIGSVMVLRKPTSPTLLVETPVLSPAGKANPPAASVNLITYRLALNRSPEDLDELLSHEAARPAFNPPTVFRVSLARLDTGF
jgi:anti-sigma factor RsiW